MTLFNLSSLEPDSWSAAVSKNFSVFVAAGRTTGGSSLDGAAGMTCDGEGWAAPAFAKLSSSLVHSEEEEDTKVVGLSEGVVGGLGKTEEDIKLEGAAEGGGLKNEPSSKVSRKSLIVY
jgi:hypothetical protein